MIRKAIIVVLTLATVGVGVTWLLSNWGRGERTYFIGEPFQGICVSFKNGQVNFSLHTNASGSGRSGDIGGPWSRPGFGYDNVNVWVTFPNGRRYIHWRRIRARAWAIVVLFATYPTIAVIRGPLRRYRRRKRGLCTECAYDLTGNESGVCPECGTAIATPETVPPADE